MNVKTVYIYQRNCGGDDVYENSCAECNTVYILVRQDITYMTESWNTNIYAVKRGDWRNSVAAHVWKTQHAVNWSSAKVSSTSSFSGRGGHALEAINIEW